MLGDHRVLRLRGTVNARRGSGGASGRGSVGRRSRPEIRRSCAGSGIWHASRVTDDIGYTWRGTLTDEEMVDLVTSHGGRASAGWWDRIRSHSLGWVCARNHDGLLVGFVNVAWDGGDHAFLLDTKTRPSHQRRGIGRELVRRAVLGARAAGCEWLHVDFDDDLAPFYFDACGFRPTNAGLIRLV